jgi:transposase
MMDDVKLQRKYQTIFPHLNERQKRLVAAADAQYIGHGGVAKIAEASGISRVTVIKGKVDLSGESLPLNRARKEGGGRKKISRKEPAILEDLESLVEPATRGDPMSALRWTCKSTRILADELMALGYRVSYRVVGELLKGLGYSLQGNVKTTEGTDHPDRDKQFKYINELADGFLEGNSPVISVDTKKKELVGNFKNGGQEWRPKGEPVEVNMHDFPDKNKGKAVPYGVYDIGQNAGWVNVGCDGDTAKFAVESIRRWWDCMGSPQYALAKKILITADSGGSNSYRGRLWKKELQLFANQTGLEITVCHFPPGTSKWNKIEHRLFSHITMNWRGKPLISHEVVVNLIGATKTRTGLRVKSGLDQNLYPTGVKVSNEEMAKLKIKPHDFHGEWNYTVSPLPDA